MERNGGTLGYGIRVGCTLCDCGNGELICPQCKGDIRCGAPAIARVGGTPLCRAHLADVGRGAFVLAGILGRPIELEEDRP